MATGEEAYSVAILLEHHGIPGRVIATDIDLELIAIARRGVTARLDLVQAAQSAVEAGVLRPMQLLDYFEEKAGEWRPSPAVRRRVTFDVADLRDCEIPSADVVLVRNVWRYLGDDGRKSLHERLLRLPSGIVLSVGGGDLIDEEQRPTGLEKQLTGFRAGSACLFVRE
ncbi:hypothetical protein MT350_04125 [Rathayibacter sp. VKM Ac-2928]|nr:hypothetical protein [Rathayibacter sp. VKM Ac-2928]